jgi:phosphatidylglycerol:prolipoprotein diacylglycerol transferase
MTLTATGLEIGPFTLHFYGLLIVTALLVSANVGAWMAKKDGRDPEHLWNGLTWAVIAGIIGARLWFVFFPPITSVEAGRDTAWMLQNITDLSDGPLAIWNGGLGIFGAIIGGALGIYLYARRQKLQDVWGWFDLAAVIVPLGQAIGRWGNFINQELYGKPTDLPWGIKIDNPLPPYSPDQRFHPLFLYESLWNLALFSVLLYLWLNYRQTRRKGDFLLFYLVGYSAARFMLEFLRVEIAEVQGLGLNSSQATTALTFIIASGVLVYRQFWLEKPTPQRYHADGRPIGKPKKGSK